MLKFCRQLVVIAPVLAFLASGAVGQGVLTFEGPVVVGESAVSAPVLKPMKKLYVQVDFLDSSTLPPTHFFVQQFTDDLGQIPIPLGYTSGSILISGLYSVDFFVRRTQLLGTIPIPNNESIFFTFDTSTSTVFDISSYPGYATNDGFTVQECTLFYQVRDAFDLQSSLSSVSFSGLPSVDIEMRDPSVHLFSPEYSRWNQQFKFPVSIHGGAPHNPTSISAIGHECGHRFVQEHYAANGVVSLNPRIDEGLADFMSSVFTGSSKIGVGINGPQPIRDIAQTRQFSSITGVDPHLDGEVIAGALFHCRKLFADNGVVQIFDSFLESLFNSAPPDEIQIYCKILELDDNDGDLTNGTPRDALIHQAFNVLHGIPMPAATCNGVAGSTTGIPSGWDSNGLPGPTLTADLTNGGATLKIDAHSVPALQFAYLMISLPPVVPLQAGPGLFIFHDFQSAISPLILVTDWFGEIHQSFPLGPMLPDFAITVAAVSQFAPYGYEITNGILVEP